MRRAPTPAEGTAFAVPLEPSGYALGVLARTDGQGRAFGYFFGPRLQDISNVDLNALDSGKALLVCKFGDHGLHTGRWPLVGTVPGFSRNAWKLPPFRRDHDLPGLTYVTEYDDQLNLISEAIVANDAPGMERMIQDTQIGSANVERRLNSLL